MVFTINGAVLGGGYVIADHEYLNIRLYERWIIHIFLHLKKNIYEMDGGDGSWLIIQKLMMRGRLVT